MSSKHRNLMHDLPITTDKDPSLGYETDNAFTKVFGFLVASILNIIPPKIGSFLIQATTKKGKEVKARATTYHALDTLYTTHRLSYKKGFLKGVIEYFWFKLGNPRAVRIGKNFIEKINFLKNNIKSMVNQKTVRNYLLYNHF